MRISSSAPPKAYLSALKERMGGHMELGQERFTGFFLGRFFTVTHHSGYEWNRRITNVKNTAIGYVKQTGHGSQAHYIHLRAMLAPTQFWFYFLMLWIPMGLMSLIGGLEAFWIMTLVLLVSMLVAAPMSALMECMVEESEDGRRRLKALLLDPADPFSYLNHQNEL